MQGVRTAAVRALQGADNTFASNEQNNTLSAARRPEPQTVTVYFKRVLSKRHKHGGTTTRRWRGCRYDRLTSHARISTGDQNLTKQRAGLHAAGCTRIFSGKITCTRRDRRMKYKLKYKQSHFAI
jgi:hypothetical protein